ncbi:molybdenum cofactor biosynthesis protein MoaE [Henriciella sp.]|uniref:molybdenum cofactor biosynthesis protein MoaE n=1 Tax=Henriciella sp. TaxID=1968823 RepID=UPI0026161C85|nr:molybdenum cofactor biosynthesis protein MoaE [Henriciella sp.]
MLRVSSEPFNAGEELSAFERDAAGAGAVVSFTGLVRDHASSGDVKSLFLQAYSPMTERGIEEAITAATERWPLTALKVIHRVGEMAPGEAIVFVATASAHRRAAFEAADFLMDYLKTEAVFWKKEATETGEHWIDPRSEDYQDRARWA